MSRRSAKEEALLREIAKVSALLDKHKSPPPTEGFPESSPAPSKRPSATSLRVPPSTNPKNSSRVWVNPEAASRPKQTTSPSSTGSLPAGSQAQPAPQNTRTVVLGTTISSSSNPPAANPKRPQTVFARAQNNNKPIPSGAKSEGTVPSVPVAPQGQLQQTGGTAEADLKKPGLLQRRLSATGVVPPATEAPNVPVHKSRYSLVMNKPTAATAVKKAMLASPSTSTRVPTTIGQASRFKFSRTPAPASYSSIEKPTPSISAGERSKPTSSAANQINATTATASGASKQRKSSSPQRNLANHALQLVWDRKREDKRKQPCVFFTKFGHCKNGDKCLYLHDKSKVAICRKFLLGKCTDEKCTLQHSMDKDKMPICFFFNSSPDGSGCKLGEKCPYLHVRVSPDAEVCPDFIKFGGYCPRGAECTLKHTDECQAFAQFGECALGDKCKMRHREKKKHKQQRIPDGEEIDEKQVGEDDTETTGGNKKRKRTPNLEPPTRQQEAGEIEPNSEATEQVVGKATEVDSALEVPVRVKRIKPNFL